MGSECSDKVRKAVKYRANPFLQLSNEKSQNNEESLLNIFPAFAFVRVYIFLSCRFVFSLNVVESSLSSSFPFWKLFCVSLDENKMKSSLQTIPPSIANTKRFHGGSIYVWSIFPHLLNGKRRFTCMENAPLYAGVGVFVRAGSVGEKAREISVKRKEGKISQQNSTAQGKCFVYAMPLPNIR